MNQLFYSVPNLIAAAEGEEKSGGLHQFSFGFTMFYIALIAAIILAAIFIARRGFSERVPQGPVAKLAEHAYLFIERISINIIGPHGKRFIPFLLTIWLFIFVANVVGLVLAFAPTADISVNLGMSLLTVFYVQYAAIREVGPGGWIKHFFGPKLPLNLVWISGLVFVVEIVSESAKIVSLALRLFGNIEGGKLVTSNLDKLFLGPDYDGFWVPLGGLLVPIKLLTAIIQAFVWVMLASVYIGLVTHHEHEGEHEEDHDGKEMYDHKMPAELESA